jgi:gamma-glutamylcyclotransferase (GGCT)/AIG2-like uncharacterized protein YtfP
MKLFAYGTLMDPEIMMQVSGAECRSAQAVLHHFVRKAVRGEVYPAIAPLRGASVDGVVYFGLPAAAFDRLDRFEGPLYRRTAVVAVLEGGDPVKAQAYVIAPNNLSRLSDREWRFDHFLEAGKDAFQKSYRGYEELKQ